MTIEQGATFNSSNSGYTSTGEQGRIEGTLIVNGTMTNTNVNRGGYGFDLHGATVTIGTTGSVTTNSNVRAFDGVSTLTVNGSLTSTGQINYFYAGAIVNVSGTYTFDQRSMWTTDNSDRNFRIGADNSSRASFTVKSGGELNVYTNGKYVFDCKTGSSFTIESGATALFDGTFRSSIATAGGECWISNGGIIKVDGSLTIKGPQTNSQTFDIVGGSATIGATGVVDSSAYTRARSSAVLTVNGELKSGQRFEANTSTVVINGKLTALDVLQAGGNTSVSINKGSTVVMDSYIFQGLHPGVDHILNLKESMKKASGTEYTDLRFASANNCTINLGDGVNTGNWIIFAVPAGGWINVNLDASAQKSEGVCFNGFLSEVTSNATYNMAFKNFENNYIEILNIANLEVIDDKLVISTGDYTETITLKAIDELTSGEFTDGWYINDLGGTYYLNNSNFIPEPSTYAAIFGALALTFAAFHRRRNA